MTERKGSSCDDGLQIKLVVIIASKLEDVSQALNRSILTSAVAVPRCVEDHKVQNLWFALIPKEGVKEA